MTNARLQISPSVALNRQPILDIIQPRLPAGSTVLEIAAGSGEHAVFLAPALAVKTWQPSDLSTPALDSIDAWRYHSSLMDTIRPPLQLDMTAPTVALHNVLQEAEAPVAYDLITCINMIHISPWEACQGLMKHASHLLKQGGLLYLYGPYLEKNVETASSNLAFDASLKARNAEWGIRQLEDVYDEARLNGLIPLATHTMPANNLSVLFEKP